MSATKDKATLDILARAREYIFSPDRWCQGQLVDQHGAHCAIGAVIAAKLRKPHDSEVDGWQHRIEVEPLLEKLAAQLPPKAAIPGKSAWANVARYNNSRSHKQVLRLFDKAIAAMARGRHDEG